MQRIYYIKKIEKILIQNHLYINIFILFQYINSNTATDYYVSHLYIIYHHTNYYSNIHNYHDIFHSLHHSHDSISDFHIISFSLIYLCCFIFVIYKVMYCYEEILSILLKINVYENGYGCRSMKLEFSRIALLV